MRYYYTFDEFAKDLPYLNNEQILISASVLKDMGVLETNEYKRFMKFIKDKNVSIIVEKGTKFGRGSRNR